MADGREPGHVPCDSTVEVTLRIRGPSAFRCQVGQRLQFHKAIADTQRSQFLNLTGWVGLKTRSRSSVGQQSHFQSKPEL